MLEVRSLAFGGLLGGMVFGDDTLEMVSTIVVLWKLMVCQSQAKEYEWHSSTLARTFQFNLYGRYSSIALSLLLGIFSSILILRGNRRTFHAG